LRLVLLTLGLVLPALAGEYAVLSTGFKIHAERHGRAGDHIRLFTKSGEMSLPADQVQGFEVEEYVPPPPPAPAPVAATPAPAAMAFSPKDLVEQAARKNGLPPELVHSIAAVESAYRLDAISPKGAIGLMQLMPGTAKQLQADPNDPAQNAEAGARYLRELLLKYQDQHYQVEKAIAAYNAGPGAVDRYKGIPPYRETQRYVEKVLDRYHKLQKSKSTQSAD
jgi:soluble lytic murein transglycosylase-like protein